MNTASPLSSLTAVEIKFHMLAPRITSHHDSVRASSLPLSGDTAPALHDHICTTESITSPPPSPQIHHPTKPARHNIHNHNARVLKQAMHPS
jgi:hypothetical protein